MPLTTSILVQDTSQGFVGYIGLSAAQNLSQGSSLHLAEEEWEVVSIVYENKEIDRIIVM